MSVKPEEAHIIGYRAVVSPPDTGQTLPAAVLVLLSRPKGATVRRVTRVTARRGASTRETGVGERYDDDVLTDPQGTEGTKGADPGQRCSGSVASGFTVPREPGLRAHAAVD